jgi:hypothetical protein
MELQQYNFEIKHRPGKLNANADALSRINPKDSVIECFMCTVDNEETFSENEVEWHQTSTNTSKSDDEKWFEEELAQQFSYASLITTVGYKCTNDEMENIYRENIQVKQVIANQPITKGGSQYTFACDTENHHLHTYCKACKRNLPYRIVEHDCIIGFGP